MRLDNKKLIDRQLEILASVVYLAPSEKEEMEMYNYVGEKAQEIFQKYQEATSTERVMMFFDLMRDVEYDRASRFDYEDPTRYR